MMEEHRIGSQRERQGLTAEGLEISGKERGVWSAFQVQRQATGGLETDLHL